MGHWETIPAFSETDPERILHPLRGLTDEQIANMSDVDLVTLSQAKKVLDTDRALVAGLIRSAGVGGFAAPKTPFEKEHPVAAGVGTLIGFVAPGTAITKSANIAAKALPLITRTSRVGRALLGAVEGAAFGAYGGEKPTAVDVGAFAAGGALRRPLKRVAVETFPGAVQEIPSKALSLIEKIKNRRVIRKLPQKILDNVKKATRLSDEAAEEYIKRLTGKPPKPKEGGLDILQKTLKTTTNPDGSVTVEAPANLYEWF